MTHLSLRSLITLSWQSVSGLQRVNKIAPSILNCRLSLSNKNKMTNFSLFHSPGHLFSSSFCVHCPEKKLDFQTTGSSTTWKMALNSVRMYFKCKAVSFMKKVGWKMYVDCKWVFFFDKNTYIHFIVYALSTISSPIARVMGSCVRPDTGASTEL